MREPEMEQIGGWIARALENAGDPNALAALREEVRTLCARHPLYVARGRS
jgi:glycine/serine hydroxymethyltransferase